MTIERLGQILYVCSIAFWCDLGVAVCAEVGWIPWWPAITIYVTAWAVGFFSVIATTRQL